MESDRPPPEPAPNDGPVGRSGAPAEFVGEDRPEESVVVESGETGLADAPPDGTGPDLGDSGVADEQPAIPPVVAVVVASGAAPHLEACLTSLRDSDYPDLTILVLARGEDPLAARVAAVAPKAFVRPVGDVDVSTAANEAMATVAGAPFLLFCHDDVVVDPAAVRVLVEEAYRSNAAVVGPKLVDPGRKEILREVGWSVDRFGVPHSEIVADELDQEQHDAVRDVFFVSDACLLARADLFTALEGFDADVDASRALDLCWRARLAGARVIVAPDARVGHHQDDGPAAADVRAAHRAQVRTLLTCTSAGRLLWIVPVAILMQLAEAVVFLLRRQRARAADAVGAWFTNLRHPGALGAARRRAQRVRVVSDAEIHALQYHGSARFSAYMTTALHAPDRVRAISDRGRGLADQTTAQLRSIRGIVLVATFALLLIGARDLLIGRVAAVGTMFEWPGVADLARSFTSEWRYAGLGAQAPAPPAMVVAGLFRSVTLGASGLGRTLLVVGCLPLGMAGVFQLTRRIAGGGWPSLAGLVVYALNPVARNAVEHGHLGGLVLSALAPWIALAVLQLGGLVPARWPRRRIVGLGAVAVAVATAWWPLAWLLPAVLLLLAVGFPGHLGRLARGAGLITGWGLALLVPWPLMVLLGGDRLGALGIVYRGPGSLGDVVRFVTGANGTGAAGWVLLVVALLVTVLATGDAARWCVGWWGVALVAWLLAMVPAWAGTAGPEIEAVLVPAALAIAVIVAVGVSTFLTEIRREGIGWRQGTAVLAGVLLLVPVLGFVGDVAGGRFHQPRGDWADTLGWMQAQRDQGPFRALWVGAPDVVPGALHRVGDDAYAVTVDGSGDLRDALPPPGGAGADAVGAAVRSLATGTTTRVGAELGPMAVRYLVLPTRPAPGVTLSPPMIRSLRARLAQQLDLRELQGSPGAIVYENLAWLPGDAVVRGALPARPGTPTVKVGRLGDRAATRGTVLWSQQYSSAWELDAAAGTHRRVLGWTNAFVGARDATAVSFSRQWWRWPAVLLELAIAGFLARRILRRGRAERRARRGSRPAGEVAS